MTENRAERRVLFHPVILVAIGSMLIAPFVYYWIQSRGPIPPEIGDLPDFSLVNQDGKPFGKKDLNGKVSVVCFFFSRCQTICPPLMAAMKELQNKLKKRGVKAQLVSITVDPEYDTPERLKKFAQKLGADLKSWTFLTGKREAIERLAKEGFKVAMGKPHYVGNIMEITHSGKLILVDQRGKIRARPDRRGNPIGYFDTTPDGLEEIIKAIKRLQ